MNGERLDEIKDMQAALRAAPLHDKDCVVHREAVAHLLRWVSGITNDITQTRDMVASVQRSAVEISAKLDVLTKTGINGGPTVTIGKGWVSAKGWAAVLLVVMLGSVLLMHGVTIAGEIGKWLSKSKTEVMRHETGPGAGQGGQVGR